MILVTQAEATQVAHELNALFVDDVGVPNFFYFHMPFCYLLVCLFWII